MRKHTMLTNLLSAPRARSSLNEYSGVAQHGFLYCLRQTRTRMPAQRTLRRRNQR